MPHLHILHIEPIDWHLRITRLEPMTYSWKIRKRWPRSVLWTLYHWAISAWFQMLCQFGQYYSIYSIENQPTLTVPLYPPRGFRAIYAILPEDTALLNGLIKSTLTNYQRLVEQSFPFVSTYNRRCGHVVGYNTELCRDRENRGTCNFMADGGW